MENKFEAFEEYALIIKQMLENVCHDDAMGNGVNQVQVIYATPPAAFSKYSVKIENGEKPGALISFYLEGMEIKDSDIINPWKKYTVDGGNTYHRAPVIASLRYKVTINAIQESQADLLQSQIMLASPKGRPYAVMSNGQWATIFSDSFTNESSVEIETNSDRISKRSLILEIQRAYLDYAPQINEHFIKAINSWILSVEKLK